MPLNRRAHHVLNLLVALWVVLGLTTCSDDRVRLEVTVSGLEQVASLEVRTWLDGKESIGASSQVPLNPKGFVVSLPLSPSAASGHSAKLLVGGVGNDGCQLAQGSASIELTGASSQSVTVQLDHKADYQGCRLRLFQVGDGIGTVRMTVGNTETSVDLSQSRMIEKVFSYGTAVSLTAAPDSNSYFSGWSGSCNGNERCVVTIGHGSVDIKVYLLPKLACNSSNWCWENPLPQGNNLNAITASKGSTTGAWVVGDNGTILQWSGVTWVPFKSPAPIDFRGVFSTDANNAIAVGLGGIIRWDGISWKIVVRNQNAYFFSIWCESAMSCFMTGHTPLDGMTNSRNLYYLNGDSLTKVFVSDNLSSGLYGSPNGSLWIGGQIGTIFEYNTKTGAMNNQHKIKSIQPILSLYGNGNDDIWASGGSDISHWDGQSWNTFYASGIGASNITSIFFPMKDFGWATDQNGILHYDSMGWHLQSVQPTASVRAIWGTGGNSAWAIGPTGTIDNWNGSFWTPSPSPLLTPDGTLGTGTYLVDVAADASSKGIFVLYSDGLVLYRDTTGWSYLGRSRPPCSFVKGIWGVDRKNFWVICSDGKISNYQGGLRFDYNSNAGALFDIFGIVNGDIWTAGSMPDGTSGLLKFDATTTPPSWKDIGLKISDTFLAIFGNVVPIVVSRTGQIFKKDTVVGWSRITMNQMLSLGAIWGADINNIWSNDQTLGLVKFDGANWKQVRDNDGSIIHAYAITGSSTGDVWVLASFPPSLKHWNGTAWTNEDTGTGFTVLSGLFAKSKNDIWALGDIGQILHLHIPSN